ncbi:MAG: chromosome segregation protein SMC [Xenococcaceae cyanobacterium]
MVHIKRIELSHFKSFGGTTQVPFLPGFTVVSGPNGSGKSNILDALLFCLGLASSKGMRADRLPDLVNNKQQSNSRTSETSVSVTFDLSDLGDLEEEFTEFTSSSESDRDENGNGNGHTNGNGKETNGHAKEWTITRRLRVTQGGSYSSTFYINGQVCTNNELQQHLGRLRIYQEGYNVVLQGDVTRIITMNSRERREIIDELAGVAEFDRKIEQSRKTLESVREREERFHIIEQELVNNRDRLAEDRIKAEKYQKLRVKVQEKQQWEIVLVWRSLQQKHQQLQTEISGNITEATQLTEQLTNLDKEISQNTISLEQLNFQVKALGEEEHLSVSSQLATQKAKRSQLQQRQQELENNSKETDRAIERQHYELEQYQQDLNKIDRDKKKIETETIPHLYRNYTLARETLEKTREQANAIATASEAWVQEQAALSRQVSELQKILNPQRTEQAKLTERQNQLQQKISEESEQLTATETELNDKRTDAENLSAQSKASETHIQSVAENLAIAEQERTVQIDTQRRLQKEQRDKQRELDKLEATKHAQQEAQGTYSTQLILNSNLSGVHGIVAQLGQVEPRYQLALEIAAGGRLGQIVVDDDRVAAAGIELLKQQRAGRATFLPLNKIQAPRHQDTSSLRHARGFLDLAVNLINCQPQYRNIFAYVFGGTVVFGSLQEARSHLGQNRIVTLDGELLEISGAMTGGSVSSRSSLRFGTATSSDSKEIDILRQRLAEIDQILLHTEQLILHKSELVKQLTQELTEVRQKGREQQLRWEQLQKEIQRLSSQQEELNDRLLKNDRELKNVRDRLQLISQEIPAREANLQNYQQRLTELEESHAHSEWQQIQTVIKAQEVESQNKEKDLRTVENQLKDLEIKLKVTEEKIAESNHRLEEYQRNNSNNQTQRSTLNTELLELNDRIKETETLLERLSGKLGETKKERDRVEANLKELQDRQQRKSWQLQKIQETQQEKQDNLQSLQEQIETQRAELPDPLPDFPESFTSEDGDEEGTIGFDNLTGILEKIQKEIRSGQKRLEAMEPVNMLALEEYEKNQNRLQELSEKLATLEAERTELLLRVEKFTTLRCRAFKEAFDAVNENFQSIFATLSDGDGYLQLDDTEDPFNGGLNLVAHPKGKPVQRLSSMSGGEKSLTALSFIFSLQKYRPSPFYAFDEVDMFLDGANVEKLSKMVKRQAEQAQFIVVSLRRPMIEASERTIGVTQARGAHTQVLGIKL